MIRPAFGPYVHTKKIQSLDLASRSSLYLPIRGAVLSGFPSRLGGGSCPAVCQSSAAWMYHTRGDDERWAEAGILRTQETTNTNRLPKEYNNTEDVGLHTWEDQWKYQEKRQRDGLFLYTTIYNFSELATNAEPGRNIGLCIFRLMNGSTARDRRGRMESGRDPQPRITYGFNAAYIE